MTNQKPSLRNRLFNPIVIRGGKGEPHGLLLQVLGYWGAGITRHAREGWVVSHVPLGRFGHLSISVKKHPPRTQP